MQEHVYIVQTPVRDTSRCDQRVKAAPHWHMGKHEAKGYHFEHLLNLNLLFTAPTHYTTGSFQSHQQSTEKNTLFASFSSQPF